MSDVPYSDKKLLFETMIGALESQYLKNMMVIEQNPAASSYLIEENKQIGQELGKSYLALAIVTEKTEYYIKSIRFYLPDDPSQIPFTPIPVSFENENIEVSTAINIVQNASLKSYEAIEEKLQDANNLLDIVGEDGVENILSHIDSDRYKFESQDTIAALRLIQCHIANYPGQH